MWLEYEPDQVVSTWAELSEIFVVDYAEASLFRDRQALMQEAGCWARFLETLITRVEDHDPVEAFGLSWHHGITKLSSIHRQGSRHDSEGRSARWLEITSGRDRLVASFMPNVYRLGKKFWLDHRFVVGCTNTNMISTVMLFGDAILGGEEWTGSPSSMSSDSMST